MQFNALAVPVVCQATSEEAETPTQLSAEWYWLRGLCDHLVAGSQLCAVCLFWPQVLPRTSCHSEAGGKSEERK